MHTGITPEFSEMGIEEYTPWEGWSEEDKTTIEEHMNYYRNKIQEMQRKLELVTKCYAKGRLSEDLFVNIKVSKKPKSDLKAAILENRNADTFANKQDEDLIDFLTKHIITDNVTFTDFDVHTPRNLQELSLAIKQIKCNVDNEEKKTLGLHINAAEKYWEYKALFKSLKKKNKMTWTKYLRENTEICKSYVNRHIQVYELVLMYPGLRKLNITFTELFKKKDKIKRIFSERPDVAVLWKEN